MDCPSIRRLDIVEVMDTLEQVCDFYCKYREDNFCEHCPVKSVRERFN